MAKQRMARYTKERSSKRGKVNKGKDFKVRRFDLACSSLWVKAIVALASFEVS